MLDIIQPDCGGARSAMKKMEQFIREIGCKIALLHEPYTLHGDVCGLPLEMRVFSIMDGSDRSGRCIVCIELSGLSNRGVSVRA